MISDLLLDIQATTSCKTFTIRDISVYNESIPVTCGQVRVLTPGYTIPSYFQVDAGFELDITMVNLSLQAVANADCLSELPDGVFEIRYSINPNDKLFVEYNFFNTCKIRTRYVQAVKDFFDKKCDLSKKEQKEELAKLSEISHTIDLIKVAAEDCGDADTAFALYEEADELLKILNNVYWRSCN